MTKENVEPRLRANIKTETINITVGDKSEYEYEYTATRPSSELMRRQLLVTLYEGSCYQHRSSSWH